MMSIDIESQISWELSTVPNSVKVRGSVDQYRDIKILVFLWEKKKGNCYIFSYWKKKAHHADSFLPSLALLQKHEILAKLNRIKMFHACLQTYSHPHLAEFIRRTSMMVS